MICSRRVLWWNYFLLISFWRNHCTQLHFNYIFNIISYFTFVLRLFLISCLIWLFFICSEYCRGWNVLWKLNCWSMCQFNWKEICLPIWNLWITCSWLFIVLWSPICLDDAYGEVFSRSWTWLLNHYINHIHHGGNYVMLFETYYVQ